MCLSLLALATSFGFLDGIQVDEIKLSGNALTRSQDPVSECHVTALSADGQQVVGYGTPKVNGGHSGFAWSKQTGVRHLPLPADLAKITAHGSASSISDDGHVFGGSGLWIDKASKIASVFKQSVVSITDLAPLPLTDGSVGPINSDGTVVVIEVDGAAGRKLFVWRASSRQMMPLLGRNGQRLVGGVLDISAKGDVFVGCSFRGTDPLGFIQAKGKYFQVPSLPKYPFSKVECLTDDGKVAFGNFQDEDYRSLGFRWSVGSTKPLPLPGKFVVQSISGKGEILAGWAQDEPALLVGETVFPLKSILREKLPSDEIDKSRIVSVKKVGQKVFLLLDSEHETTDYRITLSASALGLKG